MQKTDHIKCWWERGETGTSFIISRSVKCYNRFGKLLGSFFQSKTYTYPMNWQFHLWLFTQEKPKHVHQKSCKRMYMVALLVVANNWEQSCFCTQQTSTGAWINGGKSIQCIEKEQSTESQNCTRSPMWKIDWMILFRWSSRTDNINLHWWKSQWRWSELGQGWILAKGKRDLSNVIEILYILIEVVITWV